MHHLLSKVSYEDVIPNHVQLPPVQDDACYVTPPDVRPTSIPDVC